MSGVPASGVLAALDVEAMNALLSFVPRTQHWRVTDLHENPGQPSSVRADLTWKHYHVSAEARVVVDDAGVPSEVELRLHSKSIWVSIELEAWRLFHPSRVWRWPIPGRDDVRRAGIALRDGSPTLRVLRQGDRTILLVAADLQGASAAPIGSWEPLLPSDANVAVTLNDGLVPLLFEATERLGLPTAGSVAGIDITPDRNQIRFTPTGIGFSAAADGELDGGGVTARARASASGVAVPSIQAHSPPSLHLDASAGMDVDLEVSGALTWIATLLTGPLLPLGSLAAALWLGAKFLPFRHQGDLCLGRPLNSRQKLGSYDITAAPESPLQGILPYAAHSSWQVRGRLSCDILSALRLVPRLDPYLDHLSFGPDGIETADHVVTLRLSLKQTPAPQTRR